MARLKSPVLDTNHLYGLFLAGGLTTSHPLVTNTDGPHWTKTIGGGNRLYESVGKRSAEGWCLVTGLLVINGMLNCVPPRL